MSNFNENDVVRDSAGKFGEKPQTEPEVSLSGAEGAAWTEGASVNAGITLQRWDGDYAVTVGEQEIDVRALMDMHPLSELPEPGDDADMDFLVEEAMDNGLITHDGPYEARLDSEVYESYYATRIAEGKEEPTSAFFIDTPERAFENLNAATTALRDATQRHLAASENLARAYESQALNATPGEEIKVN